MKHLLADLLEDIQAVAVVELAMVVEGNGKQLERAAECFERQNGWGTCLSLLQVSRGHAHEGAVVRGPAIFSRRASYVRKVLQNG